MQSAFIIVTRNPHDGRVVIITDSDDDADGAAQFSTEQEAEAAAEKTIVCKAWGCQIIEVL